VRTFRFARMNSLVFQWVKGKAEALHSSVYLQKFDFFRDLFNKEIDKFIFFLILV